MVCIVSSVNVDKKSETEKMDDTNDGYDNMTDGNEDDTLKLRRLAGGSIIDHAPTFSPDGENLLIIFKKKVQVYSTTTGEWIRDLEGCAEEIVGLQYELRNSEVVVALTRSGEIVRWEWRSGRVEMKKKLEQRNWQILSFHFVDLSADSTSAFVTYRTGANRNIEWAVVDTTNGELLDVRGNLNLGSQRAQIDVENVYFHYVAAIQGCFLAVQNYRNGRSNRMRNANKTPFTIVRVHPSEEMVATGDEMGRIFLWRRIYSTGQPQTNLYHWHHTAVTSLAFTKTGTGFYSGGQESVLVQWNIDRPDLQNFLPRMHAIIVHIAVGEQNRKVAVCTADNGIQILDSQNNAKCMLQGFTYVYSDKTGLEKFPIGLRLNPRTYSVALNGRMGHLQFYSTYTRRLLYNMDIVLQNQLSIESSKILYNTRVVCAAFNTDWMATVEEWNDQEHYPELRLKFWQFNQESQNYKLNTNVEGPHDGGVKAMEFSSATETNNLLCATAGFDNYIKMWALEDSDNIYKKGKVWFCIGRTNYNNFNLECINFSQDGSLLSAGFRNTLCIYKSKTLTLKAALSAPGRFSGAVAKVDIQLPKGSLKRSTQNDLAAKKTEIAEKKRVLDIFKSFFESNDGRILQELTKKQQKTPKKTKLSHQPVKHELPLNSEEQEHLFKKIRSVTNLSLFQKIDLYQKLGIYCSVPEESRKNVIKYISKNILEKDLIEYSISKEVKNLSSRYRFKAKYRVCKYLNRKVDKEVEEKLIPVMNLLGLSDHNQSHNHVHHHHKNNSYDKHKHESHSHENKRHSFQNHDGHSHNQSHNHVQQNDLDKSKNILNSTSDCNGFIENDVEMKPSRDISMTKSKPFEAVANIKHILFATGEHAHLVVACTEHRVLIWNILTLRFQAVLKLSVSRITVDPVTSLFAAFTINDQLYVFPPNAPMILYHRVNIPKIYGAVWIPRRYPKALSLNSDWQAISTLYFLTKDQELMYLADEKDDDTGVAPAFVNEAQDIARYSMFGTFAAKQTNAKLTQTTKNASAIGVPGKAAVKSLIEMTTHTMAPNHLLCANLIEAMLESQLEHPHQSLKTMNDKINANDTVNSLESEDSDDDEKLNKKSKQIAELNQHANENKRGETSKIKQIKQREKLKRILKDDVEIDF